MQYEHSKKNPTKLIKGRMAKPMGNWDNTGRTVFKEQTNQKC